MPRPPARSPPTAPWMPRFTVTVPQNADYTRPYFARPDIEQPYYDMVDDRFLNESLSPIRSPPGPISLSTARPFALGQHVQTMRRVSGLGSVYEPLVVGPAIGVRISPRAGVVPLDARSFPVTAVIHSNVKGPAAGAVRLEAPAGWRVEPPTAPFATHRRRRGPVCHLHRDARESQRESLPDHGRRRVGGPALSRRVPWSPAMPESAPTSCISPPLTSHVAWT